MGSKHLDRVKVASHGREREQGGSHTVMTLEWVMS